MRRSVFIIFILTLIVSVAIAVVLRLSLSQTPDVANIATETPVVCQIIDISVTPNLKQAMVVENVYQQMPMFKTPVLAVTQEKPFGAGCLAPDK